MAVIAIYVGVPENDKKVQVDSCSTVAAVLADHNVTVSGLVQHNSRTVRTNDYNKTLEDLSFASGDSLHVVRKLDGAKG